MLLYCLFAHIFADFYLQNDKLIQLKSEGLTGNLIHGLMHLVLLVPLIILSKDFIILLPIVIIVLTHIILDVIKIKITVDPQYHFIVFLLDQSLHIIIIVAMTILFNIDVLYNLYFLVYITIILTMLKPVDILIELVFSIINVQDSPSNHSSSRWIGYIERILFSTLMVLKLETFVAVFIGVKTASRWTEVQNNKKFGLQFYIGTFISVLSGLIAGYLILSLQ